MREFNYNGAFSRNLGWVTEWEQASLSARHVAIAGLGGVGGSHLLTLARLGIGAFSLADFDTFDLVNMNRQAGASMSSLGRPKLDVLAEMARGINPGLRLRLFPGGVLPANLDAFLDGADLFVDGLDFFALDIRAQVFARCAERGIPAMTAAPIGTGVGFLAFAPGGQSFERYFRLAGHGPEEKALRFLMGVAPAGLHRAYLVDDTRVDLPAKRGPSTAAACELCAGMVAAQALKLLLNRGGVPFAPLHLTMDAYRGRTVRTRLRWGQAGPLQTLKRAVARRIYRATGARQAAPEPSRPPTPLHAIIEAARWAPSGDNSQPWRIELLDDAAIRIRLHPQEGNPYEYRDAEPVLLSGGMLLESLAVAASAHGLGMQWTLGPGRPWEIEARFATVTGLAPSALLAALPLRSVVRRGMGARRLAGQEKAALEAALGPELRIAWHEALAERLALGQLGSRATDIRLRAPETFPVHRRVVDWARPRSPDGIPARAIGLNGPTLRLMRWATADWARMRRVNTVLGTRGAALQLDLWPALWSAALFSIHMAPGASVLAGPARAEDRLRTGMALQRFWLRATTLGLGMQPALATLIFASYGLEGAAFTSDAALQAKAASLGAALQARLGPLDDVVFLGRVGRLRPGLPGARSVRRPLDELLAGPASGQRDGGTDGLVGPEGAVAGDV